MAIIFDAIERIIGMKITIRNTSYFTQKKEKSETEANVFRCISP